MFKNLNKDYKIYFSDTLSKDKVEELDSISANDLVSLATSKIYDFMTFHDRMTTDYLRYTGFETPIKNRTYLSYTKSREEIHNDFEGEIIDTKTSYLFNNPMIRSLKEENDKQLEKLEEFNNMNRINDLDAELCKMASICGYGATLLYICSKTGKPKLFNLNPWEVIFIEDGFKNVVMAVRVWQDDKGENFEIYTDKHFITCKATKEISVDDIKEHGFDKVPIIRVKNNEEQLGDLHKVRELIDAYDLGLSDLTNELLEDRQAKLIIEGGTVDREQILLAYETGAFNFPEGIKAYYLTKQVNKDAYMDLYNKLEYNIARFSGTPDFNNLESTGNLTNLGISFLYSKLDQRAGMFKRKYSTFLDDLYEVLGMYYNKIDTSSNFDYMNIDYKYAETKPYNITDIANSQEKLNGIISEETRLAVIPFVNDPVSELKRLKEDKEEAMKLERDSLNFGEDSETTVSDE